MAITFVLCQFSFIFNLNPFISSSFFNGYTICYYRIRIIISIRIIFHYLLGSVFKNKTFSHLISKYMFRNINIGVCNIFINRSSLGIFEYFLVIVIICFFFFASIISLRKLNIFWIFRFKSQFFIMVINISQQMVIWTSCIITNKLLSLFWITFCFIRFQIWYLRTAFLHILHFSLFIIKS